MTTEEDNTLSHSPLYWNNNIPNLNIIKEIFNQESCKIFENLLITEKEEIYNFNEYSWVEIYNIDKLNQLNKYNKAKNEKGRKLFFGNIIRKESSIELPSFLTFLFIYLISLKYGEIECVRYNSTLKYCFIIYKNTNNAKTARINLKNYKVRCSFINNIKKEIKNQQLNDYLNYIPKETFYCRWPKDNIKQQKRKKTKKQ